jgi:hypothetical protein
MPLVLPEIDTNDAVPQQGLTCLTQAPLLIVEHIRRMRGGSQAHLMRSGHDYYVVKFQGNPQGTRILVNDLLGTYLATFLGLPTSPSVVCDVKQELIRLTPDMHFELKTRNVTCTAGLQFASKYACNPHRSMVLDMLPDDQLRVVSNLKAFLGMLVFDKWTCNTDGRQVIFYRPKPDSTFRAVMIDQGFCFNACEWNFPDTPRRSLYYRRCVYESVLSMDDFEPWLLKLESGLGQETLLNAASRVPREWYESNSQAVQHLLETLDRRRGRVRQLLWETLKSSPETFPSFH